MMKNATRPLLLCVLTFAGFFLILRLPAQAETFASPILTSNPITPYFSLPVSSLPHAALGANAEIPSLLWQEKDPQVDSLTHPDPLAPTGLNGGTAPDPLVTFEGLGSTGFTPPDPVTDVGPDHFVQMVNVSFQIWDKGDPDQGLPPTILQPATEFKQLFAGTGGACETFSIVPIVLYDDHANRWLMAQYAQGSPFFLCVAVSTTPDPTGTYYLYEFPMPAPPDYVKIAAWTDAYYLSTNTGIPHEFFVHALDRNRMLAGLSATRQSVGNQDNFMMPADLDGTLQPPADSPGMFYTMFADGYSHHPPGPDRLALYEFRPDWTNPTNTTFTLAQELPTADFNYTVCGYFVQECIPQPGTEQKLDSLSYWPMFRFQYRNFGNSASLVGNFTVDGNGEGTAAIRWFEIRKTGSTYSLFQEGTYAPDANHRWMGSIAMDRARNIALGYNITGEGLKPSIRYTARQASDPPGTMAAEAELWPGTGVQTGTVRWGDYSNLVVDPVDGCHFWYTAEYHDEDDSGFAWNTRVGVFALPGCDGDPGMLTGQVTDGASVLPGAEIQARAFITQTDETSTDEDGNYLLGLPAGTYVVTATAFGYLPGVVSGVEVLSGTETVQNFSLSPAPNYVVSGTVTDVRAGWPLYAKITVPGASPVWTDPATGAYQLLLPAGQHTFEVIPSLNGYLAEVQEISVAGNLTADFALDVDAAACETTGFRYNGEMESFDDEILPPGWQAKDNIIRMEAEVWQFNDPMGRGNLTGGLSGFAIMDSDMYGAGEQQDSSLISPVLDFSGLESVHLAFDTDFKVWAENESNEKAAVEVSNDGGETWSTVWLRDAEGGDFNGHVVLDISPLAAQEPDVKIQFHYYDAEYDYWWQVDNVAYGALSCDPLPGGWVVGNVLDENFGIGINGLPVTVTSPMTNTLLTTLPTPDDPNLADGFFSYFAPAGMLTFTTTAPHYGLVTHAISVPAGTANGLDFMLPAGWLTLSPPAISLDLGYGYSVTLPLQMTNSGGISATFTISDVAGIPPNDFPWLSITPISGTVPANGTLDFQVVLSTEAITQTGTYAVNLPFQNDTPYGLFGVPIALNAAPPTPAISLSPDQVQVAPPGSTVTYTLVLANTGNVPETFEISFSEGKWDVATTVDTVFLIHGTSVTFQVVTTIPYVATYKEQDQATIMLTGLLSDISATTRITTIAQYPFVNFVPAVYR